MLDMVIVCKLSLCELCQNSNPVLSRNSKNSYFESLLFDNFVLLTVAKKLVGLGKPDVSHKPWKVALSCHLDRMLMIIVELMITKT